MASVSSINREVSILSFDIGFIPGTIQNFYVQGDIVVIIGSVYLYILDAVN